MLYFQPRNLVFNADFAAAGADLVVSNREVYLVNKRLGVFLDFTRGSVRKEIAASETLGVVTYTPTNPLNNTKYSFQLTQSLPAATGIIPQTVTRVISITTPVTGAVTATTISDQFKNEFFGTGANPFSVTTNATGAGTVVITAVAGSPVIFASWYAGGGVAGDVVNTTPGIQTRGLPANLIASGVAAADASAANYTLYAFQNNEHTGYNNTMKVNQPEEVFIWLNEEAAEYEDLVTRIDQMFDALDGAGTLDPELFALDSVN